MTRNSRYLFSRGFDLFWMGGASILLLPLFFLLANPTFNALIQNTAITLLWFANWPHFASTLSRMYRNADGVRSYPWTALVLPFAMIGIAGMAMTQPTSIGSWLVKAYTLWAPYHFCGQSFGIAILYCRRAGVVLSSKQRQLFCWFVFSSMWVMLAKGEAFAWEQKLSGITFRSLETPKILVPIAVGFFVLSGVSLFISLFRTRTKLPFIAWVPVISQTLWFTLAPYVPAYNELVPFFHSIQYLPIVFAFEKNRDTLETVSLWGWYRQNFLLGAILFWALPILVTPFGIAYGVAKGIVFATINLHHFIIDGVIWKLRDRKVAQPLGLSLPIPSSPS